MTGQETEDRGWQLALRLIAVWRRTGETRQRAVAQALAEAAQRDPTAAEQAVIGLTALGNMFMELYADCAGYPVDSVIRDAAALMYGDSSSQRISTCCFLITVGFRRQSGCPARRPCARTEGPVGQLPVAEPLGYQVGDAPLSERDRGDSRPQSQIRSARIPPASAASSLTVTSGSLPTSPDASGSP